MKCSFTTRTSVSYPFSGSFFISGDTELLHTKSLWLFLPFKCISFSAFSGSRNVTFIGPRTRCFFRFKRFRNIPCKIFSKFSDGIFFLAKFLTLIFVLLFSLLMTSASAGVSCLEGVPYFILNCLCALSYCQAWRYSTPPTSLIASIRWSRTCHFCVFIPDAWKLAKHCTTALFNSAICFLRSISSVWFHPGLKNIGK